MPTVQLPMGSIHYEEAGPQDGRPVVCVHGIIMGGTLWRELRERLAARGLRCITPTWPLGAHTTPMGPQTDMTPRGVAAIVGAFLEAMDLEDVVLVGNDSGGAVSQLVAVDHPARLGALVLTNCDTLEHFPPKAFTPLVLAARSPRAFKAAVGYLRTSAGRRSPLGYGLLSHGDLEDRAEAWVAPMFADDAVMDDFRRFTGGAHKSLTLDAAERLRGFDGPIVCAWGSDDRIFTPAQARRFVAGLPGARIVPIAGARTLPMVDQPDRTAEVIAEVAGAVPVAA